LLDWHAYALAARTEDERLARGDVGDCATHAERGRDYRVAGP
jgi:hypothetical protein